MADKIKLIPFLNKVVERNTRHYKQDFQQDAQKLRDAIRCTDMDERTFYFMSRTSGTWCVLERDVFLRDSDGYKIWTQYEDMPDGIEAYRVTITGHTGEHGDIPLGTVVKINYLDMQGDNPAYSVGNIALVMVALPQATVFGTRDRWRALNRSVMGEEMNNGVKIFAKGPMGRGYTLTDAYDVTQTQGRDLKHPVLKEGSKGMETALTTVLNYAVAPVVIDKELPVPAYYDPGNMELAINPDFPDHEAFAAIAAEVAQTRFHAKGAVPGYNRAECELDAQSVSYILCRRFGIERPMPDMTHLPELYDGWDTGDRRYALDKIQDMSKKMGRSIEKNLEAEKQRSRTPPRRPVR